LESLADAMQRAMQHVQAMRWAEAAEICSAILEREPRHAGALNVMGMLSGVRGEPQKALEFMQGAVAVAPSNAMYQNNLANALRGAGRREDALLGYQRAIALSPDYVDAHANLGHLQLDLGRLADAEQSYRRVLRLNPDHAIARLNLGNILKDLRRFKEAEETYRSLLAGSPESSEVHNNLGVLLLDTGRLEEAEQELRRALAITPDRAETHANLGNVLRGAGRLRSAAESLRRALELKPELAAVHSALIFTLDLVEGVGLEEQQAERRRWHEQYARPLAARIRPHANARDPERKLRIGYVSADFYRHSACHAFAPMIVGHDRSRFEVACYSGVKKEDDATARLKGAAGLWRSTLGVSDDALAEQVRADGIDLLVDLSGHSAGNRLLLFARKPAPVQLSAWGHPTGTGLRTMDYVLADPVFISPQTRSLYAEEVIDLPCAACYERPAYLPEPGPLPALQGRPLTYGCVNRLEKVTDRMIALWGQILRAAPQSCLLVKDRVLGDAAMRSRLLRRLQEVGSIDAGRVALHGPSAHAEHLRMFQQVDIGLDPFPQGGGVSTAEALYMGVPVVTLMGATPPSRITASLLTLLAMQGWIGTTDADYVRIALEMGRDLPRLAKVREQLRARAAASGWGDLPRYVRAVEEVYRSAWRRWCLGSGQAHQ
jgi:predicted O-linked N-acetylglucosamine transferase (SPINDLY family)